MKVKRGKIKRKSKQQGVNSLKNRIITGSLLGFSVFSLSTIVSCKEEDSFGVLGEMPVEIIVDCDENTEILYGELPVEPQEPEQE